MIAAISYSQWSNASEAVGGSRSAANATKTADTYGCSAASNATRNSWVAAASGPTSGLTPATASYVAGNRPGFAASDQRTTT